MEFYYWTIFAKRKNSTKQPASGTKIDVILKDPTSVLSPTIRVRGYNASDAVYAYIPDFKRYYFVESVTYEYPDTVISLTGDPMASFKTDIGLYEGLMMRTGDAAFANLLLPDSMNTPTQGVTHRQDSTTIGGGISDPVFTTGEGTYLLTVMSKPPSSGSTGSANGIARTYALSQAEMSQVAVTMMDQSFLQSLISEFTNPMDAIVSCQWIPVVKSALNTTSEGLYIGTQQIFASVSFVHGRFLTRAGILNTSQAFPTVAPNDYRLRAPYATYAIYLPFVGVVPIDASVVLENDSNGLYYNIYLDIYTGDVLYAIRNRSGNLISTYSGNMATQIPVAHSAMSAPMGVAGGIVSAIGGAVMAGATLATGGIAGLSLGSVAAFGAGAATALRSAEVHTQINGSNSCALGSRVNTNIEFHSWISEPAHTPGAVSDTCGYVCNKRGIASSHPGYCQFANPSISISGYDAERDQINTMMAEGFFYE